MSLTDRHRSGKVDIRMLTLLSQNYGGRVSDSNLSFARHFLAKSTAPRYNSGQQAGWLRLPAKNPARCALDQSIALSTYQKHALKLGRPWKILKV